MKKKSTLEAYWGWVFSTDGYGDYDTFLYLFNLPFRIALALILTPFLFMISLF